MAPTSATTPAIRAITKIQKAGPTVVETVLSVLSSADQTSITTVTAKPTDIPAPTTAIARTNRDRVPKPDSSSTPPSAASTATTIMAMPSSCWVSDVPTMSEVNVHARHCSW
ncbi:hypothetical protein VMT65_37980 [Nocardia sp. CDC153]|uniref:hypothetical protein n=1 Tax=Nocardia sp. CDC153 TaxID=3112167 RepID=UPI002DB7FEE8|nr:hypothetical protein [Nocardia sp. CDC153]MEC3958875.1 hypothetical protein [Nocardia sp. CDC153]